LLSESMCCSVRVCVTKWEYVLLSESMCCSVRVCVTQWEYVLLSESMCYSVRVFVTQYKSTCLQGSPLVLSPWALLSAFSLSVYSSLCQWCWPQLQCLNGQHQQCYTTVTTCVSECVCVWVSVCVCGEQANMGSTKVDSPSCTADVGSHTDLQRCHIQGWKLKHALDLYTCPN